MLRMSDIYSKSLTLAVTAARSPALTAVGDRAAAAASALTAVGKKFSLVSPPIRGDYN